LIGINLISSLVNLKGRTKENFLISPKILKIPPFLPLVDKVYTLKIFLTTTIGVIYLKIG
jgi:hypothetical protein